MSSTKIVSTTEAAKILGKKTEEVRVLIHEGKLKASKTNGKYQIKVSDLKKLLPSDKSKTPIVRSIKSGLAAAKKLKEIKELEEQINEAEKHLADLKNKYNRLKSK